MIIQYMLHCICYIFCLSSAQCCIAMSSFLDFCSCASETISEMVLVVYKPIFNKVKFYNHLLG